MRVTLPESDRKHKRGVGGASVSVVLHSVLIAGAVAATGLRAEAPSQRERATELIYLRQVNDPPPAAPVRERRIVPPTPTTEVPPVIPVLPNPVIVDPTIVPTGLPPIDQRLGEIPEPPRTAGHASGDSTAIGGAGSNEPFTAPMVEREVRLLGTAQLRYPSMLQGAGISGEVTMQYVVDTLGRVEKESVRAIESNHPLFTQAVRDALFRMRFAPAEAGGRKVLQLVEQRFGFQVK
ncbi:MAG: TonB family protein [Gemmatimonadaceae bacterium]